MIAEVPTRDCQLGITVVIGSGHSAAVDAIVDAGFDQVVAEQLEQLRMRLDRDAAARSVPPEDLQRGDPDVGADVDKATIPERLLESPEPAERLDRPVHRFALVGPAREHRGGDVSPVVGGDEDPAVISFEGDHGRDTRKPSHQLPAGKGLATGFAANHGQDERRDFVGRPPRPGEKRRRHLRQLPSWSRAAKPGCSITRQCGSFSRPHTRRSAHPVLALQRLIGNRGTVQVLARDKNRPSFEHSVKLGTPTS
jgi:hypothetical protein